MPIIDSCFQNKFTFWFSTTGVGMESVITWANSLATGSTNGSPSTMACGGKRIKYLWSKWLKKGYLEI